MSREKWEMMVGEEKREKKDQTARERITSKSDFHSVSQTVIQTGCSRELPKLFTLWMSVFAKGRLVIFTQDCREHVKKSVWLKNHFARYTGLLISLQGYVKRSTSRDFHRWTHTLRFCNFSWTVLEKWSSIEWEHFHHEMGSNEILQRNCAPMLCVSCKSLRFGKQRGKTECKARISLYLTPVIERTAERQGKMASVDFIAALSMTQKHGVHARGFTD